MTKKQAVQFLTVCLVLISFGLWLMLSTASCTVMDNAAKSKAENVLLEWGQKFVMMGWNGAYAYYIVRPMRPGETAEVYKIFEPVYGRVINVYESGSASITAIPEVTYDGVPPSMPWPNLPPVVKDPSIDDDDDTCVDVSVDDDEDVLTRNASMLIN